MRKEGTSIGFYKLGTAVLIQWDPNEERGEGSSISVQPILKNWNTHTEGALRLDIIPNRYAS